MKHFMGYVCLFAVSAALLGGCGAGHSNDSAESAVMGKVSSALSLPNGLTHDVTQVHFKAVHAPGNCNDAPVAETTTAMETEALVPSLDPAGVGGLHAFADGLFTLPPGDYLICATPLAQDGRPSAQCALASATTSVTAEQTSEILLASQCDGHPNGLGDNVVIFNDPPKIDDLQIGPSKFINQCESAHITVTASDPNNEALSYSWQVLSGPGSSSLVGTGNQATFTPSTAGDYQLKVTVLDPQGGLVTQTFPIHVSAQSNCAVACPSGTVDSQGYCWVVAQFGSDGTTQESGSQACSRVGLTGSDSTVTGLVWTPAAFQDVASKLGCTIVSTDENGTTSMFVDTAANECFSPRFSGDYVNYPFDLNGSVAVDACRKAQP